MQNNHSHGHIRSYMRRGRITDAQKRTLTTYQHLLVRPEQLTNSINTILAQYHFTKTVVEIGFGNGESLIAMAKEHPQHLFIGIEVHKPGVASTLAQIVQLNLTNLLIVADDAYRVLDHHMPKCSVDRIQIFFPDPWPKKSHHKRRLINQDFLNILLPLMKSEAILHIATDWEPYATQIMPLLQTQAALVHTTAAVFAERSNHRIMTKFEASGLEKGHHIFEIIFQKIRF